MWRVAAAFAVAHVALIISGISMQDTPRMAEGAEAVTRSYGQGDMTQTMAGGLVEAFGFLLLIPAVVFLARAVGRRTETARWAAETALLAGVGYVVLTLAVGLAPGAAALYGIRNGLDVDTATALNNVRNVGYFLSLLLLGVHALGVAIAARIDKVMGRWGGWGGLIAAVALFASAPLAAVDQQDWGTLVWLVWWLGVALAMARHRPAVA
jgi:hypothetical protein